jgi:hypothetical protein
VTGRGLEERLPPPVAEIRESRYVTLAVEPWVHDVGCIFGALFSVLAIIFAADNPKNVLPVMLGILLALALIMRLSWLH